MVAPQLVQLVMDGAQLGQYREPVGCRPLAAVHASRNLIQVVADGGKAAQQRRVCLGYAVPPLDVLTKAQVTQPSGQRVLAATLDQRRVFGVGHADFDGAGSPLPLLAVVIHGVNSWAVAEPPPGVLGA